MSKIPVEVVVPIPYSLNKLTLYFLKLGTFGFGGPIPLMNNMKKSLVEENNWISKEEYLRGLALAQLIPGPIAVHLAIYIGYIRDGILGATLVSIAFIVPSLIMVIIIAIFYVKYGGLEWMQALFYGVGAAIVSVMINAAYNLTKFTLKGNKLLWSIFLCMGVFTVYAEQEIIWLFLLSGLISLCSSLNQRRSTRHQSVIPLTLLLVSDISSYNSNNLSALFFFFVKAGALIFGAGLGVVPLLHAGVVTEHHWLTEQQFLDAVAVAMITPGPVLITVAFIGYLIAGLSGALVAALGVFLPSYLFVVIPAPYFQRYADNVYLRAFIDGVTAAAMGALSGAIIILAKQAISDIPTIIIAIASLVAIVRFKLAELAIIGIAALVGLILFYSHLH